MREFIAVFENNVANVVKKTCGDHYEQVHFSDQCFRDLNFSISVGVATVDRGSIRVGVAVSTISPGIGVGTIVVAVVTAIILGFGISLSLTLVQVTASIGRQGVGVGAISIGSRVAIGTIGSISGVSGTIVVSISQARVVLGFGFSLSLTLVQVTASISGVAVGVGPISVGSGVVVGTIGSISRVSGTIVVSVGQVLGFGLSLSLTLSTEEAVISGVGGVGTIVVERVGSVSVSVGLGGQVGSSGNLDRGGVQGGDGTIPVPDQLGVGLGLRLGHGGENDTCENLTNQIVKKYFSIL